VEFTQVNTTFNIWLSRQWYRCVYI